MTNHPFLCDNADAVTADWMQQVLTVSTASDPPAIRDIEVENLGAATNAFGNLLRCHLTTHDGSPAAPETVIVKLPASDPLAVKVARWLSLHKREYHYYSQVAQYTRIRSPSLLYGDFDDKSHQFVLVLEDLRNMETTPQAIGVEAARALVAVREIAGLHGQFWNALDGPPVSGSYDALSPKYARFMQTAYLLCLARVLDRFSDHFSPTTRRLVEVLGPRIVALFGKIATGPRTFIHGDYRGENMFFGAGDKDDFVAIDWQGCGIGNGLYDVSYFLGTSVPVDDRRRIEREALQEYSDIIRHAGAKDFTFDDCWRSYRQNMLSAFIPCVLGCGALKMDDKRLLDLAKVGLERILTAIEELDAGEFLPERHRFLAAGYGFSTLSQCGYNMYKFCRRLRGK